MKTNLNEDEVTSDHLQAAQEFKGIFCGISCPCGFLYFLLLLWPEEKVNPYEEVDQEKYSNLVQSVLSSRGVSHTPGSVEEDALLCGPVSKHNPPKQGEDRRVPQNWFPIFNPERSDKPNASDPSVPLKIPLQRNVIPSVTRVLQQTMTKQQIFWLERWKQRMILELGEDGFKEYNSNIFYKETVP